MNPEIPQKPEPSSAAPQPQNTPVTNAQQQPVQQASTPPDYSTPNYGENGGDAMHAGHNLAGVPKEFLGLFEHDASEVIMLQTTKHPIGLVGIYGGAALGILLIFLVYGLLVGDSEITKSLGIDTGSLTALGGLISLVLSAMVAVISLMAGYVYKKSRLILTNQKVVYINYRSLISRQISQLNIGEVEDVSVTQPSLIHRIFKTGNLTIETAGEQHNYNFMYAKNPHEFAHRTVQAHEGTIREYGN